MRMPKDSLTVVSKAESTEIVRQGLRMLWHCGNDVRGRQEMLKAGAVKIVTEFLQNSDGKVRETAVCALNVISLETKGKEEVLTHSVEPLALLLHSNAESAYLHETCVQLCRCAAELPAFRFAFAEHIIDSVWLLEKIFGTPALAAISPLLSPKRDEETRTRAAQVISHFLRQAVRGDEIRVPPVPPSLVENPPMYAMEECVGIVPNLLTLMSVAPEPALDCLDALTDVWMGHDELREILADHRVAVPSTCMVNLLALLQKEVTGQRRDSTRASASGSILSEMAIL